jgi:hypothetical protein
MWSTRSRNHQDVKHHGGQANYKLTPRQIRLIKQGLYPEPNVILKEFQDLSPEDVQIEKVMRIVGDAINEFPNEDDRDMLVNAFERLTIPEADIFSIADRLAKGKITVEDIKTIVQDIASKLGLVSESRLQINSAFRSPNEKPGVVDTALIDKLLKQIGPYLGYSDWREKIANPDYKGIIQQIAKHVSGTGTLSTNRLEIK